MYQCSGVRLVQSGLIRVAMERLAPGDIRSLIQEKEKELHDINEYRIRTLEALLRDKVRRAVCLWQAASGAQDV